MMSIASSDERYFVQLVNATRAEYGLDPLRIETSLNDSSDAHSAWLLAADVFSHTGRNGSSPTDRIRAGGLDLDGSWMTSENIAYRSVSTGNGLADDIRVLHQMLMDSPSHRANILNPDADLIGIGLKIGDFTRDGSDYKVLMVTQNFAATGGDVKIDYSNGLPHLDLPGNFVARPDRGSWIPHFDGDLYLRGPEGVLTGSAGGDDVRLGWRDNRVHGGSGQDWLAGGAGADTLDGQGGDDRILGEDGADRLLGGTGNDLIVGGLGNDTIFGWTGNDRLAGDSGADLIFGGDGADRIAGGIWNDRLVGGNGNDFLRGDSGHDRLEGDAGNDTMRGGAGNDTLSGGAGEDSFVFGPRDGIDRVLDFDPGQDRILIAQMAIGTSDAVFIRDAVRDTAAGVVIDLLGSDQIILVGQNLNAEDVTETIFLT